jgi:hypothetical protein
MRRIGKIEDARLPDRQTSCAGRSPGRNRGLHVYGKGGGVNQTPRFTARKDGINVKFSETEKEEIRAIAYGENTGMSTLL